MTSATLKPKSVKLATWLNVFPLIMGLGYLYVGKPVRFIVVFGLQLFTLAPMEMMGLGEANKYLLFVIWVASIFDANSQAKAYNRALLERSTK